MTARRKSCKQPLGSVCVAAGKRGVCSLCTDMTAIRAARKKQWKDPEFRKRNAEAVKANWKDPEFRKRQAEATKANWKDPEFRKRQAEAVKANWKDPEFRKRNAEAVKANWKDPEFRKRQAEATKAALAIQWDDDMDAALRDGLRRGHKMEAIAEHIGVCIATATKRAGELGLERARRGGTR